MARDIVRDWMWSEACDMLARADRMHRSFFSPTKGSTQSPAWEPPVDVIETEREVIVLVALPGVDASHSEAVIDGGELVVSGTRVLPKELHTATIHRLELPQGRFARRVPLPAGRYRTARRASVDGCLLIALEKVEGARG